MIKKNYIILMILFLQTVLYSSIDIEKYFLIDKNNVFNSSNIYKEKGNFLKFSETENSFGLETNTVWLYIKIKNSSNHKKSNIIEFSYPLLDFIEVLEYKDGIQIDSYLIGDLTKFSTRKDSSNTFVIPYEINENSTKEFIFGITTKGSLNLKMNLLSKEDFIENSINNTMILGIYYGSILIMLIYNLFLYFMIKEKMYLYYVIFHFFFLLAQLSLNGLAFKYFWPDIPEINSYFFFSIVALANYTAILFANSFLEIYKLHKKLYIYFRVLKYFTVIVFISNFIFSYAINAKAIALLTLVNLSSLFISAIYVFMKDRTASSKFFILAWGFMLFGILLTELSIVGILPANIMTLYGNQMGALLELSLLSIALAHRYNTIFFALSQREDELRVFNEQLEKTIFERTKTINTQNTQLSIEIKNKNILLKELFHRVKNNLQIVSSILYTHSTKTTDKNTKDVLTNSMETITSIGMIHEKLYTSGNLEEVNFKEYLHSLIDYMKQSIHDNTIKFNILCQDIMITLKNAVPLGLIVNEIITNSIKHAFKKSNFKENQITLKIEKDKKNLLYLEISDNGVGFKEEDLQKNFGFKLIESLTSYQLKGNMNYIVDIGVTFKINFYDIDERE